MVKKRFIAGAVCPRCAAMDTVYVVEENGINTRACADCGFEEQANFEHAGKELPTRVNQTQDKRAREKKIRNSTGTVVEIQKIKIIDNKKPD